MSAVDDRTATDLVDVSVAGGCRTITLNRPDKANALTAAMLARLAELLAEPAEAGERVIVLAARGPTFCAGLDLAELRAGGTGKPQIEPALDAITHAPLPVIAAVHGPALAGGVELALHCDFIVADAAATFKMPLARQGLVLTWALTAKLVEALGPVVARRLLLAGEAVGAAELADVHAIHAAVPADRLAQTVFELVTAIEAGQADAVRAFKLMIARIADRVSRDPDAEIVALVDAVKRAAR